MPGYNESGPEGNGPMTGRGTGICNTATPGYGSQYAGAGNFGRGAARRRGRRRGMGSGMNGTGGKGMTRRRSFKTNNYPAQDAAEDIDRLKERF